MAETHLYNPGSKENLANRTTVSWTSNGSGAATETVSINGTILRFTTNPGSTAPTDNYDITLTDEDGYDVLGGAGANRDTATTESFVPQILGSDATTVFPVVVAGTLTLAITNAGDTKNGTVVIYHR
jgi:hypothetical protein